MKTSRFILFVIFLIQTEILSQSLFGNKQVIDDSLAGCRSMYLCDVDCDSDLDIVAGSYHYENILGWYENIDGIGNFSKRKEIATSSTQALSVCLTDLDSDGDCDILLASFSQNSLTWYEYLDETNSFDVEHVIATSDAIFHPSGIFSADIDGDNDFDVVATSGSDIIAWFENIDGNGTFSSLKQITNEVNDPHSIYLADVDGDNDFDLISASYTDNKIAWYENTDGTGSFGTQQVICTSVNMPMDVYAIDIDGDSDLDLLSASAGDNKIAWFENQNSRGTFSSQKIISNSADGAWRVYAADLDGDSDIDVLSSSLNGTIAWYENMNSMGNFSSKKIILDTADYAGSVCAVDIDNDNDMDIFSCINEELLWFKNLTNLTSVKNDKLSLIKNFQLYQNYPNPFNPSTTIRYKLPKSGYVVLQIYNLAGEKEETLVSEYQTAGEYEVKWEARSIPSGVYVAKLQTGKYIKTIKLVLLR